MDKVLTKIPPMLFGEQLKKELSYFPYIDREDVVDKTKAERIIMLSDLYMLHYSLNHTSEVYSKIYLALINSLKKKQSKLLVKQQYTNYFVIHKKGSLNGIIGGADSFSIIGTSGVGKTSALNRVIETISSKGVIETTSPKSVIIPVLLVQTPFDASVKSLLIEILRKVDETIGTDYYRFAIRKNLTVDSLIGQVSTIAINHLAVLVLDEIQNVVSSKNGRNLIGCLTQLINSSGISLCFTGTPEVKPFFEKEFQIARRCLGIELQPFKYDLEYVSFIKTLFKYQYTINEIEFDEVYAEWLYSHSLGNPSVIINLWHDSQEIAIINESEIISIENLEIAFRKRLTLLNRFLEPKNSEMGKVSRKVENEPVEAYNSEIEGNLIKDTVNESKGDKKELFKLLCNLKIAVEEVKI